MQSVQAFDLVQRQGVRRFRPAAPHTRARAWGVDQDQVGPTVQVFEAFAVFAQLAQVRRQAGARQARLDIVEPRAFDVGRDQGPLAVHHLQQAQGLAAAAGAIVDDRHAGPCAGEKRRQLRALVLDLDQSLTEGRKCPNIGRRIGRQAHAMGRERRGLRPIAQHFQAGDQLVAVTIDAQVDRRARQHQAFGFGQPTVAIDALQALANEGRQSRLQPLRCIARGGRQAGGFGLGELWRGITFAAIQRIDLIEVEAVQHMQGADDQGAAGRGVHQVSQTLTGAHHLVDLVGDGAAVFRAGITVGAAPVLEHGFRGGATAGDLVQHFGGGLQSGGRGQ